VKSLSLPLCLGLLLTSAATARAGDAAGTQVRVPFELLVTKHIVVMIKINDRGPYRMIFDTGAPVSILNTKSAKETGLISKAGGGGLLNLFGSMDQVKIKKLEMGDLKALDVPVIVMDHPTVELASRLWGPIEGIIGFPFFARYRMTLDYQSKELTFARSGYVPGDILQTLMTLMAGADKPAIQRLAPPGVWGFSIEKGRNDEEAGVVVKTVLPDSPAAKGGLKAADRLLSLDDRWTDTVTDCYSAAQYVKPGSKTKVRIKRDGREIELLIEPQSGT